MLNDNAPTESALGYQVRSSHSENMIGKNRLGALIVRTSAGIEFKIGTGFDATQREFMWLAQASLIGKIVTFKHQAHGQKEAPRIPVFVGIRSPIDIS